MEAASASEKVELERGNAVEHGAAAAASKSSACPQAVCRNSKIAQVEALRDDIRMIHYFRTPK